MPAPGAQPCPQLVPVAQVGRRSWALGKEGSEQWGNNKPVLVEAPKMATAGYQDLCVSISCFRALLDTWSTSDE